MTGWIKEEWLPEPITVELVKLIKAVKSKVRWSVKRACKTIQLLPDRFYRWRKKLRSPKEVDPTFRPHALLPEEKDLILEYAAKEPTLKHRKLAHAMRREDIAYVSESTVYRVLKENKLIQSDSNIKPPLKKTDIKADQPNVVWRTDLSYIEVGSGHCYLITVLDKYSRKIIYHELCYKMTTKDWQDVIAKALDKVGLLNSKNKPILISDNGTQLTAKSFKKFIKDLGLKHVRTAYRHPESNGQMEVFFKTLKYEHIYLQDRYENMLQAKLDIDRFIKYYNEERLHQALGYVTPEEEYQGLGETIRRENSEKLKSVMEQRKAVNRQRRNVKVKQSKSQTVA